MEIKTSRVSSGQTTIQTVNLNTEITELLRRQAARIQAQQQSTATTQTTTTTQPIQLAQIITNPSASSGSGCVSEIVILNFLSEIRKTQHFNSVARSYSSFRSSYSYIRVFKLKFANVSS